MLLALGLEDRLPVGVLAHVIARGLLGESFECSMNMVIGELDQGEIADTRNPPQQALNSTLVSTAIAFEIQINELPDGELAVAHRKEGRLPDGRRGERSRAMLSDITQSPVDCVDFAI
jgi:hypothetical protein